jgi:hypothetical protein
LTGNAHVDSAGDFVTDHRFDPTGIAGATFDLDWFAFSDGDFDHDGITDLDEGTGDTDADGL